MDSALVLFLVVIAVLSGIPAWLTGSILKRRAREEGAGGTDWLPFGFLPYALSRFQHPHRFAIVWAYVFSNVVSWAAIIWLLVHYFQRK